MRWARGHLIRLAADESVTRDNIAHFYAFCIASKAPGDDPEWGEINQAIMDRWSRSGLIYIKKMAWGIVERTKAALLARAEMGDD